MHLPERAERIGARQLEAAAIGRLQRFRQQEAGGDEIQESDQGRPIEGHPHAKLAEQAADDRPEREAGAEGDADQAEIARTIAVIADIGDEGGAGGEAGAADAGKDAADEQDRVAAGQRADQVVDGKGQHRGEQDRPSPEAVGKIADQRREQELHAGIGQQQPAAVDGGGADVFAGHLFHESRHDRHDDGDADHIQKQDDEDKKQAASRQHWIDHDCSPCRRLRPLQGTRTLGRPSKYTEPVRQGRCGRMKAEGRMAKRHTGDRSPSCNDTPGAAAEPLPANATFALKQIRPRNNP